MADIIFSYDGENIYFRFRCFRYNCSHYDVCLFGGGDAMDTLSPDIRVTPLDKALHASKYLNVRANSAIDCRSYSRVDRSDPITFRQNLERSDG